MNTNASAADTAKQTCATLLETLVGLGTTWATYGLKMGKVALEQSADALGKTAHTLSNLAEELEKKAAPPPPADAVVDADAPHGDAPAASA